MQLEGEEVISENITDNLSMQQVNNVNNVNNANVNTREQQDKLAIVMGIICCINLLLSLSCSYSTKYFLALNSILYLIFAKYCKNKNINLAEYTLTFLIMIFCIFFLAGLIDLFSPCEKSCLNPCKVHTPPDNTSDNLNKTLRI